MSKLRFITAAELYTAADDVARVICSNSNFSYKSSLLLFGIPRGGIAPAYAVSAALAVRDIQSVVIDTPGHADIFIDDLTDSGATLEKWCDQYPEKPFYSLFNKMPDDKEWYIFPWEQVENNTDKSATDIPLRLLQFIGEDVNRGGLVETPERFLKAWKYWTKGYDEEPSEILKSFEDGAEDYDQLVLVKDIPLYSHCEHHLAPFFGVAHVGYIPNKRIVGLSKINRLVDVFARRLQVQERLTNQIASALQQELNPFGVAVILECRHMCMESRGICQQGHSTTTSAMHGIMRESDSARAELLELLK